MNRIESKRPRTLNYEINKNSLSYFGGKIYILRVNNYSLRSICYFLKIFGLIKTAFLASYKFANF